MGLSRTASEREGDLSRKSQNVPIPLVFCAPAEEVPLGIGYWRWGQKTRTMVLPGLERSLTISSAIWIQYTNVKDGQTDGHRATTKTAPTHSVAR